MKKTIAATVAVIALVAGVPLVAGAGDYGRHHGEGRHAMKGHHGMMGHHADRRGRGHSRIRMMEMIETYDADGDGAVTQTEVDQWRAERLAEFDADGDGQLSLDEYERLWLDAMHERMVDRFQGHDDDGDGQVTADEFGERTGRMVMMRDRNGDGLLNMQDLRRGQHGGHGPRGDRPMPPAGAAPQNGAAQE